MHLAIKTLLERRPEFLAYLHKQGATADQAEDLLQSALERGLEPWRSPPSPGSVVPWFYRVLRNSLIDHARRSSAAGRALQQYAHEASDVEMPTEPRRVCTCARTVLASLKPEYARLIELVDVNGVSVDEAAGQSGITPNNAYVRLHRARKALRERLEAVCGRCATGDGRCTDCYCQSGETV
jgi:RNA polymerase sigma-70 factor (ECF subfamily)